MSVVVYCLYPCCLPSDCHRCLLFLRCISVDVRHCHATSPPAALLLRSSRARPRGTSLHGKSHFCPLVSSHLPFFIHLFRLKQSHWACIWWIHSVRSLSYAGQSAKHIKTGWNFNELKDLINQRASAILTYPQQSWSHLSFSCIICLIVYRIYFGSLEVKADLPQFTAVHVQKCESWKFSPG